MKSKFQTLPVNKAEGPQHGSNNILMQFVVDSNSKVLRSKLSLQVASQLICEEIIRPGVSYQYVIVRNDKGDMKLYLNGYLCASGLAAFAYLRTLTILFALFYFVRCGQDPPRIMASLLLIPRVFGSFTQTTSAKTPLGT